MMLGNLSTVLKAAQQVDESVKLRDVVHRISFPKSSLLSFDSESSLFGNASQNRSVSSPAPVTIVSPAGLMAR
jgi:hypothetical protein